MATFTAEFVGGHADGHTFTIPRLVQHINTPGPIPAIALYETLSEPADLTDRTQVYSLAWDPETGAPARTARGNSRYDRHPQRAYPDLPVWLLAAFPRAYAWAPAELGRWTARERLTVDPDTYDVTDWRYLYVGVRTVNDRVYYYGLGITREHYDIALAAPAGSAGYVDRHVWKRIERQLDYDTAPECMVPGCTSKGMTTLTTSGPGRLLGRNWTSGQDIRLCPGHYVELARIGPHTSYDELPEWVRVDAVRLPDPFAADYPGHTAGPTLPTGGLTGSAFTDWTMRAP